MTRTLAPGAYRTPVDIWGSFGQLARRLPPGSLCVVDKRVLSLHPAVARALAARRPLDLVALGASERVKTWKTVSLLAARAATLPRSGTMLCVGGGTLGDACTVVAHLIKRGVNLIHVPSTLLAAVDSSLGGKGALHVDGGNRMMVKNALGVFHYPVESWLCPALFETLSPAQHQEGAAEALKMFVCLSPTAFSRWSTGLLDWRALVVQARRVKAGVCRQDPYDITGARAVLNFGHTLGHALESVSRFSVRHGQAVGLGMLCALDVGRLVGVTPQNAAFNVENVLGKVAGVRRKRMARALAGTNAAQIEQLLAQDKKGASRDGVNMVLLRGVGDPVMQQVPHRRWRMLLAHWKSGTVPPC